MSNYIVDGDDLTSVANAIRAKGGTSGALSFPNGFISAVEAIETGGNVSFDDYLNRMWPTGDLVITSSHAINRPVLLGNDKITSLTANNITGVISASECVNLVSVQAKKATSSEQYGFNSTKLAKIGADDLPALASVPQQTFLNCRGLTVAVFKSCNDTGQWAFNGCTSLTAVDFGGNAGDRRIYTNTFNVAPALTTLIIRGKSRAWSLTNLNAFTGTPFASNGTGGTLYVPQDLIASYQAATNWSTILGYANNQILPIEGSMYETQYADGTPIA